METVPCPISSSTAFTPWLKVPDRFDDTERAEWQLVRSSASGLIMLNPRPDYAEAESHYRNGAYDPYLHAANGMTFTERAYLSARTLLLGYRADIILKGMKKPPKEISLLEIGCSTGDLLNCLHRKKGIPKKNIAGVEPDFESRKFGREQYGLTILPSIAELADSNRTPEKFAYLSEKLDEKGILVLALPNPASSDARHYRENWIAWDAPRHLYHFVPDTLEKLLDRHDLQIAGYKPYFPDSLYNTLHSEKLRCKREKRGFSFLQLAAALLKAIAAAGIGALQPLKASSLVYFIKERS
jgi:hypothetical protein